MATNSGIITVIVKENELDKQALKPIECKILQINDNEKQFARLISIFMYFTTHTKH